MAQNSLPIEEIVRRWRAARAYRGWNQRELADELELDPSTVKRYESGKGSEGIHKHLEKVARLTGLPYAFFEVDLNRLPELLDGETATPAADDEMRAALQKLNDRVADIETELAELATRVPKQRRASDGTNQGQHPPAPPQ